MLQVGGKTCSLKMEKNCFVYDRNLRLCAFHYLSLHSLCKEPHAAHLIAIKLWSDAAATRILIRKTRMNPDLLHVDVRPNCRAWCQVVKFKIWQMSDRFDRGSGWTMLPCEILYSSAWALRSCVMKLMINFGQWLYPKLKYSRTRMLHVQ
jgi:hypothetical protein